MSTKIRTCEHCDPTPNVPPASMPEGSSSRIWVRDFDQNSAEVFANKVFDIAEKDPHSPIMVYIDSPGGEVDALMAMISAVDAVPNPLITIAMGRAFSAAAVLLSHGDSRFVAPYSRVMIHEISSGTFGHIKDIVTDARESERVNKVLLDILARNCDMTTEALHKRMNDRDTYLGATEAVEFGLADAVGVPTLKVDATISLSIHAPQLDALPKPVEKKVKAKTKKKAKK